MSTKVKPEEGQQLLPDTDELSLLETVAGYTHFSTRGHSEAIASVAASITMDYIATGSNDGSMRVWAYESYAAKAYQLKAVVEHSSGGQNTAVTALKFVGESTVASATSTGDLMFFDLVSEHLVCKQNLHTCRINALITVCDDNDSATMHLVTASSDKRALVLQLTGRLPQNSFSMSHSISLHHDQGVLAVDYLSGPVTGDNAKWVTCSTDVVQVWSANGALMSCLRADQATICSFTVSDHDDLILVADGQYVSVWDLTGGLLTSPEQGWAPSVPTPLERYKCPHAYDIEVVQADRTGTAPGITEWIVDVRMATCVIWGLRTQNIQSADGSGSTGKLVQPGYQKIFRELSHSNPVSAMAVVYDPEDGPLLLTGCEDGIVNLWDINGHDAGELCAQLRSLNVFTEILFPMVMLFITFFQFSSFAFGPSTQWTSQMEQTGDIVYDLSTFNINLHIKITRSQMFWAKSVSSMGAMILFLVSALCNLPYVFDKISRLIKTLPWFVQESANHRMCGTMHLLLNFWQFTFVLLVKAVMLLMSTCLVVPVTQACVQVANCIPSSTDSKLYLRTAPHIVLPT